MQSFVKKSLVVFAIAILLLSAVIVPNITSADEQSNPATSATWQTDPSVLRAYNSQTGALNYISFPPEVRSNYDFKAFSRQDVADDLATFGIDFGIGDTPRTMKFMSSFTGNHTGATSYRYQQIHEGVPVFAGEILMNYDANGNLAAVSGETSPNPRLSTTPHIDANASAQAALSWVSLHENIPMAYLSTSKPELWIYDPSLVSPYTNPARLVWRMEVTTITGEPIRYLMLMDAHLGGIALSFNQIDTAWGTARPDSRRVADLPLPPTSPHYWLPTYNGHAVTYNSNNTSSRGGTGASTLECDDTQPTTLTLFGIDSCDGTGSPASDANGAQYFALEVFNYFDFYFGRNSINDAGMTIISNVLFTPNGSPYDNAFWDGSVLTYGNDGFQPSDDIVGHEMSHGITQYTSNLMYYFESGAMNEAMSDIFGEYYDMLNGIHSRTGNADPDGILDPTDAGNWYIGEDETNLAFRYMANPPEFNDPDRMRSPIYFAPQHTDFWNGTSDSGGVHINSGVANKAAYLMAEGGTFNGQTITPLGATLEDSLELAGQIWYDTEYLLTSGSDYGVLDLALVTACTNLIGVATPGTSETLSAADCTEVSEVTDATEMHLEPSAVGFSPEANTGCTDPADTTDDLFFNDMESGTLTGFTAVNGTGIANRWSNADDIGGYGPYAWSGTRGLWSGNFSGAGATDNHVRLTSALSLTGGVEYYLYFNHVFAHSSSGATRLDGAIIEYSTDGGTNWLNLAPFFADGRDYNGTIAASAGTVLANQLAFSSDSHGYNSSRYNLSSLWEQNVLIRWRIVNNGDFVADMGWILDDVRIYRCMDGGPTNTITPTASNTPTPTPTHTATGSPTDTPCVISVTAPNLALPTHRTHTTDTTPSFSWSQVNGAQSYRLMVYTEDRSFEYKKRRVGQTSTSYTLTAAEALTPQKYLWRVRTQDLGCGTWTKWSTRNTLFVD